MLTPMRRTVIGVDNSTCSCSDLNLPSPGKTEVHAGFTTFRLGDKVMQIRNNYQKQCLTAISAASPASTGSR